MCLVDTFEYIDTKNRRYSLDASKKSIIKYALTSCQVYNEALNHRNVWACDKSHRYDDERKKESH